MSEEYEKPSLAPVMFDFENSGLTPDGNSLNLGRKDVLGIVQSAFDELGPVNERLVAVKREVLAEVVDGKLADALRTAIVGAGKAGCTCCR